MTIVSSCFSSMLSQNIIEDDWEEYSSMGIYLAEHLCICASHDCNAHTCSGAPNSRCKRFAEGHLTCRERRYQHTTAAAFSETIIVLC